MLSLKSLLLNLIELPGVSMNFKSTVISTMLRLLVSFRRVKTDSRQLQVHYVNGYFKQWDPRHWHSPSSPNKKHPQPIICWFIRCLSKDNITNQRRNARRVDPSTVGLPEDTSLSAVRIFDHLMPRMQKVTFEGKRIKEQFHYQYCWSKGSFVYLFKDN
mgnify:CR=1 FL=1